MEQRIAVLVSAVLGLPLLFLFAAVARTAPRTGDAEVVATATTRWRRTAFWTLALLFIPVIGYSLTKLPYAAYAPAASVIVTATGHQWAWEVTPATVPVNALVEIRVTGADVNHGFGLYDANNRLITQTQGMPGYTNVIRYTFSSPGTYRILCLEYCGLGHHTMFSQLVVTAAP